MPFATGDLIEIDASQFRAVARVRNVMGDRIHVALENGYLPWIDDPVILRRAGDPSAPPVDARIVHASGSTAMIELLEVTPAAGSSAHLRDTMTDEP